MRSLILIGCFVILLGSCDEPVKDPLTKLIQADSRLRTIADNPEYEVQIIYTQIDRDSLNQPSFHTYDYGLDDQKYFYPASTVKFPAVLIALEKLNRLGIPANARVEIDSAFSGQTPVIADSTAPDYEPSIAHYAKKILLVSDNDAFNRLYEFIGQDAFNKRLTEKGYPLSRMQHRLSIALSKEENQQTNPFRFYLGDSLVHSQPAMESKGNYTAEEPIQKGRGYQSNDEIVNEPFDFSSKNFFRSVSNMR